MFLLFLHFLQLLQQNNPDTIEPVSQSYLVELSVVAPSGQVLYFHFYLFSLRFS